MLRGREAPELRLGRRIPLTRDPGMEIEPTLSPDGRLVAYASGLMPSLEIRVRQVDGGSAIAVAKESDRPQRWPSWSPDGSRIMFALTARHRDRVRARRDGACRRAARAGSEGRSVGQLGSPHAWRVDAGRESPSPSSGATASTSRISPAARRGCSRKAGRCTRSPGRRTDDGSPACWETGRRSSRASCSPTAVRPRWDSSRRPAVSRSHCRRTSTTARVRYGGPMANR